ncbi:excalibur calcium-binding domain-containing protein [Mesorhizobium sp. M0134]|uniref:excalibur calcium-binding domain-containing protein n=1 Tax=Mesorhizobium sp. M0134 TaxID=2956889 RepID=UPI00333B731E
MGLAGRARRKGAAGDQPAARHRRRPASGAKLLIQPRRTCSKISPCDEAQWYLGNCPWGGKLDRDGDGRACETLC